MFKMVSPIFEMLSCATSLICLYDIMSLRYYVFRVEEYQGPKLEINWIILQFGLGNSAEDRGLRTKNKTHHVALIVGF